MGKAYKIRRFRNGKNKDGEAFTNYSLTIPSAIAEKLPEGMLFECTLTDEGILFRPATQEESNIELPKWATKNGKPKSSRARPQRKSEPIAA